MKSLPPIVRALAIFAIVVAISWAGAGLLIHILPANRTNQTASVEILISAILEVGGPIIGLFLAVNSFIRLTRDRNKPPPLPYLASPGHPRKSRAAIFVMIGVPVGLAVMGLCGAMVIPVAWLAGGGDMPAGHGNPNDMQVGRAMLYIVFTLAGAGAILFVTALVIDISLLLRGRWNRE
jgi:hypothetical protein